MAAETTVAPHGLAIHRKALAARLLQQHRVHERPREAVTMRAPSPRQPEKVLRVLCRRHGNISFVIQVRNPHRKLQREGLREAARRARQRRLVVHSRPAVCQRLRELLRLCVLRRSGAKALRHGATGRIPKHVGGANKLLKHAIHEILSSVSGCGGLQLLQRARKQQHDNQPPRRQDPALRFQRPQLRKEIRRRLLVVHLPRLAAKGRRLRLQLHPPASDLRPQNKLRALKPPTEYAFVHLRVRVALANRSNLLPALGAEKTHVEPRAQQVLTGPRLRQGRTVGVNSALRHDFVVAQQVERARVVPLVHGPQSPVQTPATHGRQRVQDVRHQAPAQLQALEHAASAEVTSQHQRINALQELRMPRHAHAWRHVRELHETFPKAVIVRQHKLAAGAHLLDRRRPHQGARLISCEHALLVLGGTDQVLQPTLRRGQRSARAKLGVHAVPDLVAAHQAHALRKGRRVLREGDHILPELRQARLLRCHEGHLHVLERNEHGLRQRRRVEESRQLLVRKHPHRIHVVSLTEFRDDGALSIEALVPPFLLEFHVAPTTRAAVLPSNQEVRLRSLQRRQLIPLSDLHIARGNAIRTTPQQLKLQVLGRLERRVKRWKTLTARVASEKHHTTQHRLLRTHSLQRPLPQHHVELRHAQRQRLHRQHDDALPQELRLHTLLALRHGYFNEIAVRVQPSASGAVRRTTGTRPPHNATPTSIADRQLHMHFWDCIQPRLRDNLQNDLRSNRATLVARNGQVVLRIRDQRPIALDLRFVGASRFTREYNSKALETLRATTKRQVNFLSIPQQNMIASFPQ